MNKDKTLLDNNRTLLNLNRSEVANVLPEFYGEEYGNLVKLFEKYYDWLNDSDNPGGQINRLYASRDATQVPEYLLNHLEDELLLGQAYFGGFINKREAVKRSNLLYRSKGTKYSIEQFFRAFYGIDPVVVYTKENIFKVGPAIDRELANTNDNGEQVKIAASKIGPESRRFLTDNKLYQTLALLIRTNIPITEWSEVYKLFVHPAGVYVGSEILIEVFNTNTIQVIQDDVGIPIREFVSNLGTGNFNISAEVSVTLLSSGDIDQPVIRQSLDTFFSVAGDLTATQAEAYVTRDVISPNSITFDDSNSSVTLAEDSDGSRVAVIINRFDEHKFSTEYDSSR